ncbi:hypothetical protein BraRD5C2_14470 [Bradyrhizobium sp. RD5-C2]|nr:hypothetical protein BraRD5C2_14470 [Bradyrhizobium sp. RD5-C2]
MKKESGAEAVLDDEVIGEISPPPQAFTRDADGHEWRSKLVSEGYHITPKWPSGCGPRRSIMPDMVGMPGIASWLGRPARNPVPILPDGMAAAACGADRRPLPERPPYRG